MHLCCPMQYAKQGILKERLGPLSISQFFVYLANKTSSICLCLFHTKFFMIMLYISSEIIPLQDSENCCKCHVAPKFKLAIFVSSCYRKSKYKNNVSRMLLFVWAYFTEARHHEASYQCCILDFTFKWEKES